MLLRMVLCTTVYVFYVSCFTVFLAAFNCNWFMEGQGEIQTANGTEVVDLRFRLHRFPEVGELASQDLLPCLHPLALICLNAIARTSKRS